MARKRAKRDNRPVIVVKLPDRTGLPINELSPKGLSMYTRRSASGVQGLRMAHAPLRVRRCDHNSKDQIISITPGQL